MDKSVSLPTMFNQFGKRVIDSTRHLSIDVYFTQANEHFISVISFYLLNIQMNENLDNGCFIFDDMVQRMLNYLQKYQTWELLLEQIQLHSEQYPKLTALVLNDELFYMDDIVEWSKFDILKRNMILDESVKRLKYLFQRQLKEDK
ncbi:hypothetical protein ACIQYL_20325 [Lysinibacillus xylanilyticus]|uniref:hypothetical protein n=1 Tax=Lysinibacillus xylanilyticus TaxID=582475 RepID=UPI00380E66C3